MPRAHVRRALSRSLLQRYTVLCRLARGQLKRFENKLICCSLTSRSCCERAHHRVSTERERYMKRRRARTIVVALILSLTLSVFAMGTQVVRAYNLEGPRWPNQPSSGCCLDIDYYIASGTSSTSTTAWNNAVAAWNGSTANYFLVQVSSTNSVGSTYNSSVGWDGITTLYSSGNTFTNFQSLLNTYYTENHDTCGHWPFHDCYTDAARKSVAAHEFGHVAGLAHTSSCVLMNPATFGSGGRFTSDCGYINVPKSDDINGVNAQY